MSFTASFIRVAQNYLPAPFTIAILLTLFTVLLALVTTGPQPGSSVPYPVQLMLFWEQGFWGLLEFAMQMMLMLVLGHVLALTAPFDRLIRIVLKHCTNTARSAAIVTFLTIAVAWVNWGLGLIFGAILARKVGDQAMQNKIPLNYPLIGGAGYVGMMVWHGGLSGSAPIKVAEPGHFLVEQMGIIPMSETVFSPMNLTASAILLLGVPAAMYWLGTRTKPMPQDVLHDRLNLPDAPETVKGGITQTPAERLDNANWLASGFGLLMLGVAFYRAVIEPDTFTLAFLTPNFINFVLFALGLTLYGSFIRYVAAIEEAIIGAAGIMIQFPLYAGIAGIMQYSGLIQVFSSWIIDVSTPLTYPVFTFYSAALVNTFVPSGGGQWAVQGPIVVESARQIGVPMAKCVMALAYGDQATNMLQPFWALPLLGITRLSAQEILPYTLFLLLLGTALFTVILLVF